MDGQKWCENIKNLHFCSEDEQDLYVWIDMRMSELDLNSKTDYDFKYQQDAIYV